MKMSREQTGVLAIDFQERLLPTIHGKDQVLENAVRLIKGAAVLGVPLFATEQYRKGLGPTVSQIATAIPGFSPIEKLTFSAAGADGLLDAIRAKGLSQVLLCGIEAHVCVCQTCLDLVRSDFTVFVATDAISSRTPENQRAGIERMREAGAVMVTTEMALFELLGRAGTEEFKQVLSLVK